MMAATIRLGAQCETNGLTPVNTGGDGEIRRGKLGEAECYQLAAGRGKPGGYPTIRAATGSPFSSTTVTGPKVSRPEPRS